MIYLFRRILGFFLGFSFLLSGGLKSLDPFGGALKISEYLKAFDLSFLIGYETVLIVLLSSLETLIGIFLMFDIYRRITALSSFLMMSFFTSLTAYLAFSPYVSITACGCFGEAIPLTNHQTFYKNVVLLFLSVIVMLFAFFSKDPKRGNLKLLILALLSTWILPIYSLYYLPPIDFLSYNIGTKVNDSKHFRIFNQNYVDVTDSLISTSDTKPLLLVVFQEKLTRSEKQQLIDLRAVHHTRFTVIGISSMAPENIVEIPIYSGEATFLKELLRAKSGIVRIDQGVIKGKWRLERVTLE